jgi:hypothetical protein
VYEVVLSDVVKGDGKESGREQLIVAAGVRNAVLGQSALE